MTERPYNAAVDGAGFLPTVGGFDTIMDNTVDRLADHTPEVMLVTGGINDFVFGNRTIAEVIDAADAFEAEMTARDIQVIWVAEPAWKAVGSNAFSEHLISTRPDTSIDCRAVKGQSLDQLHPSKPGPLARCVETELALILQEPEPEPEPEP